MSIEKDFNKQMKDYLPLYYHDIKEAMAIISSEAKEVKQYHTEMEDILLQFYVDKATWGLDYWERACEIKTDTSKPLADRRSAIKAKIRGIGTMTVTRLKTVADSFYTSEVKEETALYTVHIKLVGVRGEPANLPLMEKSINEVVPAHLKVNFVFTYLPWSELELKIWNDVDSKFTWSELEVAFL